VLTDLSDTHGAEDIEKDEGAVGKVIAGQIPMADSLEPGDWYKR